MPRRIGVVRSDGVKFVSSIEAAKYMGKKKGSMIDFCIAGKRKTAYGYTWRRDEIEIIEGEIFKEYYGCRVSNFGRVITKYNKLVDFTVNRKGYQHFELKINGTRKHLHIARVVLEVFVSKPPFELAQADHINGDKSNNKVENLRWLSCKDNVKAYWDNKKSYR